MSGIFVGQDWLVVPAAAWLQKDHLPSLITSTIHSDLEIKYADSAWFIIFVKISKYQRLIDHPNIIMFVHLYSF